MIVQDHNPDRIAPNAFRDLELPEPGICHAVTVTTVFSGTDTKIFDVVATADADVTTGNIAHGLGVAPAEIYMTPLLSQALAALSAWAVTTVDATNIVATKLATAGSGNAGVQIRIIAKRPHSLGR